MPGVGKVGQAQKVLGRLRQPLVDIGPFPRARHVDDNPRMGQPVFLPQQLDERVGVGIGAGVGRCHHQHAVAAGAQGQLGARDSRRHIHQHSVIVGRQRAGLPQQALQHRRGHVGNAAVAAAAGGHLKTKGGFHHNLKQGRLARQHVAKVFVGLQVQLHVDVRQPRITIYHQHFLALLGPQRGHGDGQAGLAHTALAAGDGV